MTKTCINYATWWKMPFLHLKQWRQWQPVTPKGLLLSSPSARSGRWYFGLSYFDDTPPALMAPALAKLSPLNDRFKIPIRDTN